MVQIITKSVNILSLQNLCRNCLSNIYSVKKDAPKALFELACKELKNCSNKGRLNYSRYPELPTTMESRTQDSTSEDSQDVNKAQPKCDPRTTRNKQESSGIQNCPVPRCWPISSFIHGYVIQRQKQWVFHLLKGSLRIP